MRLALKSSEKDFGGMLMGIEINRFGTIELLSDHLAKNYNQYVAMPQRGGGDSVSEFNRWLLRRDEVKSSGPRVVFFPSDPTTFLIFPTLRQEIEIFRSASDKIYGNLTSSQIAHDFRLTDENLDQPVHTLSGGERTKAALLKVTLLLRDADEISISSPAQWLDEVSRYLLERLVDFAIKLRVKITFHTLEGDFWPRSSKEPGLEKKICNSAPTIGFKQSHFSVVFDSDEDKKTICYLDYNIAEISKNRVSSPVLITGDNGAGKSVFAKCMAGMLIGKNDLTPLSSMGAGFGRIILQDCLSHYFRCGILGHPSRVFDFDSDAMKRTSGLFRDLCDKARKILCNGSNDDPYFVGTDLDPSTLLQAKLMLVAERLAYCPPVLILDEPAWGLSLMQSYAFLFVTISYCHDKGVPVVIISHDKRSIPFDPGGIICLTRDKSNVFAELKITEG